PRVSARTAGEAGKDAWASRREACAPARTLAPDAIGLALGADGQFPGEVELAPARGGLALRSASDTLPNARSIPSSASPILPGNRCPRRSARQGRGGASLRRRAQGHVEVAHAIGSRFRRHVRGRARSIPLSASFPSSTKTLRSHSRYLRDRFSHKPEARNSVRRAGRLTFPSRNRCPLTLL